MHSIDFVRQLLQPESYPHAVEHVELRETHISWVFLTGEYAYKLKKPVDLGFANFVLLEDRQKYCHEEVRRNRLYSQGLYLDVVPVCHRQGGLAVDGEGEPIDFAVKMRQFDDSQLASRLASTGRLAPEELSELAEHLACLHRQARRALQGVWGTPQEILPAAAENVRVLRQLTSEVEQLRQLDQVERWTQEQMKRLAPVFAQRKQQGFVRECHGDLHLGNLVRWNGRITLFDCIEFNANFYWIDVINEIAFLIMDLEDHGCSDLGWQFLNTYLESTGDYGGLSVLRFYLVYRAMVRAKVCELRLQQNRITQSEKQLLDRQWHSYLSMACRYLEPPPQQLAITHGVSGSGKTFGTQWALRHPNVIRLRSDVERNRFPTGWTDQHHPPAGQSQDGVDASTPPMTTSDRYAADSRDAVYERLELLSRQLLAAGFSVVVDATFLKRRHRSGFQQIAQAQQVPFSILKFDADPETLRERIRNRLKLANDASEATEQVLEQQLSELEPLDRQESLQVVASSPESLDMARRHAGR